MSEEMRQQSGRQTSTSSMVLVIVLWAMVLIPLAWGVYQTLKGVDALFTGDSLSGVSRARPFYGFILSLPE
jgi:hypothetical protein